MIKSKAKLIVYLANLISLAAFITLLIFSLKENRALMGKLFLNASYYLILLIFIIWISQLILFLRDINFSLKQLFQKHWIGILSAFVLSLVVFSSVHVGFKTLSDETNLISIANSMFNDKTCGNGTMGKYYYDNLNVINNEIPKRPLIYPFMVQVLHTLTGFRYQNAFIFNFIVMFLFLAGVFIAARSFLDIHSSIAAIFLIISYPVFTIFSTSAGFDVLNSVFFMMILAAAYCYIRQPSYRLFAFIFASLIVFSNIRYESPFLLLAFPPLLLVTKKIKWDYIKKSSWLFFITPLVMLPYLWQRILRHDAYQNPEDTAVFSFAHLVKNLGIFFKNLVDLKYFLPYAGFLSIISIVIFIYLLVRVIVKRKTLETWQKQCLIVLTLCVLLSTAIFFAHFFGDYTHPSSARLFITLSIIFALGPVILKIAQPRLLPGPALLIVSILCFMFYHPIAVEGRFINVLTGNRSTEQCISFLSKVQDKNILIIALRPGQFVAMGYGSVNFAYVNQNQQDVLTAFNNHLFARVFVFQEIEYKTGQPSEETKLPPDYNLETLREIQNSPAEFLRICELKHAPAGK